LADVRAIFFDLDGTLLDGQGRIGERTLAALEACHRRGVLLYVATARSRRLAPRPAEAGRLTALLLERGLYHNGAMACDAAIGYERHYMLPAETVGALVADLSAVDPALQIAIQRGEEYNAYRLPMSPAEHETWGFSPDGLPPLRWAAERDCSKVIALHPTLDLTPAYGPLTERYKGRASLFLTDSGRCLQAMACGVGKERAATDLLAARGISMAEAAAFGDDVPDAGLLAAVGWGVAMGNASPTALRAARYVTRGHDDDGVAYALEDLLGLV
jgi:hydroxymethylpyrimidine pyrophosphatase-like HAD family hydrolase